MMIIFFLARGWGFAIPPLAHVLRGGATAIWQEGERRIERQEIKCEGWQSYEVEKRREREEKEEAQRE